MTRLIRIDIDDSALPPATPEMEQERKVAIFDLIEDNSFAVPGREGQPAPQGPFRLDLGIRERRLVFDLTAEQGDKVAEFHLSLGPLRQVTKDYFQICQSHFDAVKRLPPAQIEAIDMARRFGGGDLRFAPGSDFDYSPLNWVLVNAIVTRAANRPFGEALQDLLFRPLGLRSMMLADGG